MSRGKRYEQEPKLNLKKVFAVVIAIAVVIMFVFIIKGILLKGEEKGKITSKSYYTIFKDNKWGVIDSNGDIVIDPAYEEMITIPDQKKDVFVCTYNVNYETGEYKTKALDSNNKEIFTDFEQIESIPNTDEQNNVWYESNVLKVKKDGKYGLIDLDGKEILKAEYSEIFAMPGIENSLKIKKDDKYGIVNTEGKIIIEPKYQDITTLGKDDKSGFIVKNENGKYGIVSYLDAQILDAKFDEVTKVYGNDLYVVKQDNKIQLVGKDSNVVLSEGYDEITGILKNKENGIIFKKDKKYGVMKITGEVTINPEYEDLKEAKDGILIAKKGLKYGLIDITNTPKIEAKYMAISYNEKADLYILEDDSANSTILNSNFETKLQGILNKVDEEKGYLKIRVGDEYKYYNFKFEEKKASEVLTSNTLFLSKKDGKYGFVDKNGNVVVEYIYDDAKEQKSSGFAAVKKDGKWGSINSKGNVVIEPTYNLDNYLVIDFIGKWHLGQDMNLNYYIQ